MEKNKKLERKLEEILPESIKDCELLKAFASFQIDEKAFILDQKTTERQSDSPSDSKNILEELEKLKSYLNNVELQLYEANEHISDLLEKVTKGTL